MKIHVNSFVKRQTPESEFSHFEGTWELLQCLTEKHFSQSKCRPGYREGVVLVDLDSFFTCGGSDFLFYSGVVQLQAGDNLVGEYKARREGETPRKSTGVVNAKKMPAKSVFVVLYASTVLAEDGDNELPAEDGNWEIISINASPLEGEMPINPMTLMHNHFGSDGGTATNLTDSEFVAMLRESFEFWKDKAMVAPEDNVLSKAFEDGYNEGYWNS